MQGEAQAFQESSSPEYHKSKQTIRHQIKNSAQQRKQLSEESLQAERIFKFFPLHVLM